MIRFPFVIHCYRVLECRRKKTLFWGKILALLPKSSWFDEKPTEKNMETFPFFHVALHLEIAEFFFLARPYEGNTGNRVGWLINPQNQRCPTPPKYPPIPGWFSPQKMPNDRTLRRLWKPTIHLRKKLAFFGLYSWGFSMIIPAFLGPRFT